MTVDTGQARMRQGILDRTAHIGIWGLGYVGLPLAVAFAEAGFRVTGIDPEPTRVEAVNSATSYVEDIASNRLAPLVTSGRLAAATDPTQVDQFDIGIIAVPTPIDAHRIPDLSMVRAAGAAAAKAIRQDGLVVLESTTYPGTTSELLVPLFEGQGRILGETIFVGYSPERIDPGNARWPLERVPKVVAGMTALCREFTDALYRTIVDQTVLVSGTATAEMTKLFENIFRVVNIALVNELQVICDGFDIDVWEVLAACATKPYGFMSFTPGPGLGGHCIPVDPFYLAWSARGRGLSTEFIELAGRINASMPRYVVDRVAKLLNSRAKSIRGSRVGLIGVAYKKNTADLREAPAVGLWALLAAEGAEVTYHDPHVPQLKMAGQLHESQKISHAYLDALDCAVIVTDHDVIDWRALAPYRDRIVDTRHALARDSD